MARSRPRRRFAGTAWLFAAPGLIVYAAFLIYPALRSVWLSFTSWDGISPDIKWTGLANYRAMLDDPVVHTALRNNALWLLVTTVVPLAAGLALAVALNGSVRFKSALRMVFYLPAVLPLVSVGTIWGWLYDPSSGAVNTLLRDIGLGSLAHPWLGDSSLAIWATMVPACWVRVGFPLVLYLAALQHIPGELYESARTEGASGWQQFRYITFPSLRGTHYVVLALSFIEGLKVFDIIFATTNGGPGNSTQVLGTWMFFNVFQSYKFGYGTAMAVVVTVAALAVGIPYVWRQTKESS
ncbi:carbohydrate ABC transporter permease [Streptomyces sp. NBC_00258]|uniref:carbohydrate ABC transporter permease n=1 Tax=Streptomyces sp. NBC_00258 TaxID=2903642 RepID=UPI002E2B4AF6|nr:sugar ABC transporter permease [Streptomyces sp. NBC_00258]